jgi:hypothetical protein
MQPEIVDNLATGQLHSAWTHVPQAQQQIYMQARGTAARAKGKPKMQLPQKPYDLICWHLSLLEMSSFLFFCSEISCFLLVFFSLVWLKAAFVNQEATGALGLETHPTKRSKDDDEEDDGSFNADETPKFALEVEADETAIVPGIPSNLMQNSPMVSAVLSVGNVFDAQQNLC